MEPKRRQGFAGQGRAICHPVATTHSRRESSGSEGGLCTMDQSEGRIHYWGRVAPLPQWSAPTQSTLPPRLRQVRWEGWKRFLSLYDEKSLNFSLVPW